MIEITILTSFISKNYDILQHEDTLIAVQELCSDFGK